MKDSVTLEICQINYSLSTKNLNLQWGNDPRLIMLLKNEERNLIHLVSSASIWETSFKLKKEFKKSVPGTSFW